MGGKGHHLQPTKEKHDKENLRVNIIILVRYSSRYDTASYRSASTHKRAREGWVPEPSTPLPRAHRLQPQAAPSAAQPDATSSRYFTWRQETGEVQPLSTTFSSASSSQGDVFGEASGSQGGTRTWQQLREMPCGAGHCFRAQGALPRSRVPSPSVEMPHGCSAGI